VYSKFDDLSEKGVLLSLSGAVVAFIFAALMHWWALAVLGKIKD